MPISFNALNKKLDRRLKTLDAAFERYVLAPTSKRLVDRYAHQEGLMSALWQTWCGYWREVVIGSAGGAVTLSGHNTNSPYIGMSEQQIAFVASKLAKGQAFTAIQPLAAIRFEPTWGDPVKLNAIVQGIGSTNKAKLDNGISGISSLKDLQNFRNANAHINADTLLEVKNARVRYSGTNAKHPSDTMLWIDRDTKDYLWRTWIDEVALVAMYASE